MSFAGATVALTAAGKKFTILKQVQSKIEVFYQRAKLTPKNHWTSEWGLNG
jgi:hypothetical protein